MVYPRTYEEALADGEPLNAAKDWNPLVVQGRGFTPVGVFTSPYSYLVVYNPVTAVYNICNAFQILHSDADSSTAITWALANLTGGRSWKEKVVLIGDMGAVHDIEVPSYSIVEGCEAKLTLLPDETLIFVDPPVDVTVTNVDFVNLRLIADQTARSVEAIGADLGVNGANASNIGFCNNYFQDFRYNGVGTPSGIRGKYDGLTIKNNRFVNGAGAGLAYPIYLASGCNKVVITGNSFAVPQDGNPIYAYSSYRLLIANNFLDGIDGTTSVIEGVCLAGCHQVTVESNSIINCGVAGILVHAAAAEGGCSDIQIKNNDINACKKVATGRGIILYSDDAWVSTKVQIDSNNIYDCLTGITCGQFGLDEAHIFEANLNHIEACTYPIICYGTGYNARLIGNTFRSNTNPPFLDAGTIYAKANEGYLTENSGVSMGTGAGQTIAHGLGGVGCEVIPNRVFFSELITGGALTVQWAAADGTNIYPLATDDKDYVWKAEKV